MSKPLETIFSEVIVKESASKTLQKLTQLSDKAGQAINHLEKGFQSMGAGAQKAFGTASSSVQSFMTSGGSGVMQKIPGLGSFFSAASSAVESAAQEFVAGVTTNKNVRLIEDNFAKAFGRGAEKAFSKSMFRSRDMQEAFGNLADMGVSSKTLMDGGNRETLEKLARSQGVGSIQELLGRITSGQLKEGRGLSKMDIEVLKHQSQLLGNRFTADQGMQMILQLLRGKGKDMSPHAASMEGLARAVKAEGNIQTTEENYRISAAGQLSGAYGAMIKGRLADLRARAKAQPLAQGIQRVQTAGTNALVDTFEQMQGKGKKVPVGNVPAALIEKFIDNMQSDGAPPGKALGGQVRRGKTYVVGERRPELFTPGQSGTIIPRVPRGASAGAATITFNIYETGDGRDTARKVREVMAEFFRIDGPLSLGLQVDD